MNYGCWIDLFAWGTSNTGTVVTRSEPWKTSGSASSYGPEVDGFDVTSGTDRSYDWGYKNEIHEGTTKYPAGTWRTPNQAEWEYLLNTRKVNDNTAYSYVKLHNGIIGVLIYPDVFRWEKADVLAFDVGPYTITEINEEVWNKLEEAGCVFLPGASRRNGKNVDDFYNTMAHYWSSTASGSDNAIKVEFFFQAQKMTIHGDPRSYGNSVRLVRDVFPPCDQSKCITEDTIVVLKNGATHFTWKCGTNTFTHSLTTDETLNDFYDTLRNTAGCDSIIYHLRLMNMDKVAFSISSDQKAIFSPGNVQYCPKQNTWRFAERQFDRCGHGGNESTVYWDNNGVQTKCDNQQISSDYAGWIDLFGWGTGKNPSYNSENHDYSTFTDWGSNVISGYSKDMWRTLTNEEWRYLLDTRKINGDWSYSFVHLKFGYNNRDTVRGLIIYPDQFNWSTTGLKTPLGMGGNPGVQSIDATQWAALEKAGCVFLPNCSYRYNNSVTVEPDYRFSDYWSSTPGADYNAFRVHLDYRFKSMDWQVGHRHWGSSVRLIKNVGGSCDADTRDTTIMPCDGSKKITWKLGSKSKQVSIPDGQTQTTFRDTLRSTIANCDSIYYDVTFYQKTWSTKKKDTLIMSCDGLKTIDWKLGSKSKTVSIPDGQMQTTFEDTLRSTICNCDSIYYKVTVRKVTWETKRRDTTVILYDDQTSFTWKVDNKTLSGTLTGHEAQKDFYDIVRSVWGCDSLIYHLKLRIADKVAISVSDTRKVIFSPANLQFQASTGTWRFGEHQYDRCGAGGNETTVYWNNNGIKTKADNSQISETYAGWIDLFSWGTSGKGTKEYRSYPWLTSSNNVDYGPESGGFDAAASKENRSYDWGYANEIMEGTQKHRAHTWRTPDIGEWRHILTRRAKLNGDDRYSFVLLRFGDGDNDTVRGVIIYPDGFMFSKAGVGAITTGESAATSINADTWAKLETAGCVFLPGCGYRSGTSVANNFAVNANYWSSTAGVTSTAFKVKFYFQDKKIGPRETDGRLYAFPIRLIKNIPNTPCEDIETETRDTSIMPCDGATSFTWTLGSKSREVSIPSGQTQTTFDDTLRTKNGLCDSIYYKVTLRKKTWSSTKRDTSIMPCDGGMKMTWTLGSNSREVSIPSGQTQTSFDDTLRSKVGGCDSIYYKVTLRKKTWERKEVPYPDAEVAVGKAYKWVLPHTTKPCTLTKVGVEEFKDTLRSTIGGCDSIVYILKLKAKKETGAAFSVGDKKRVEFSPGNLQYCPKQDKWRFAERQFDRCGAGGNESTVYWNNNGVQTKCNNELLSKDYAGWIDMFFYGTSGINPAKKPYYIGDNADYAWSDWGQNIIGDYTSGMWRTLTSDEWDYLINRTVNGGACYSPVNLQFTDNTADAVAGAILYLDGFTWEDAGVSSIAVGRVKYTTIDAVTWAALEKAGCVFLPSASYLEVKDGTLSVKMNNMDLYGSYWSSTPYLDKNGQAILFLTADFSNSAVISQVYNRSRGLCVRLVQDIFDPCADITIETKDTTITICKETSVTWKTYKTTSRSLEKNEFQHHFYDTLRTAIGCDSIYYHLLLKRTDVQTIPYEDVAAVGSQYTWDMGYKTVVRKLTKSEEDFYDTLRTKQGCDSIISHLKLKAKKLAFFSIGGTKKVKFSSGNLQYCPKRNQWRFAERQFDRCGAGGNESTVYWDNNGVQTKCNNLLASETYGGWIDLFSWGASGYGDAPAPYELISTKIWSDWGQNVSTENNTWRTPTADDWVNLLDNRTVNGGKGYSFVTIQFGDNSTDTVSGLLLYHDNFTWEGVGISPIPVGPGQVTRIDAATWDKLDKEGCVFLPSASRVRAWANQVVMEQTIDKSHYSKYGYYWTSTYHLAQLSMYFTLSDLVNPHSVILATVRHSVRLVQDVTSSDP